MEYHKLEDTFVCFIGIRTIESPRVSDFISTIQSLSLPEVTVLKWLYFKSGRQTR